jgi:hypothetical protein
MLNFFLRRHSLGRWCLWRRTTAIRGSQKFLARRWLCHAWVPHWSDCRSWSWDFNRRDWNVRSEQSSWQCIVTACEAVHVDFWTTNPHGRVVRWRWKLHFRESLVGSLGLVHAVPAHWSEVARKSDRHAGSWSHGKSCTRRERLNLVLSQTIAKGGLFKKMLKARRYCSAVANEKVI